MSESHGETWITHHHHALGRTLQGQVTSRQTTQGAVEVNPQGMTAFFQSLGQELGPAAESGQDQVEVICGPDNPVRPRAADRNRGAGQARRIGPGLTQAVRQDQAGLQVFQVQGATLRSIVGDDEHGAEKLVEKTDPVVEDQQARDETGKALVIVDGIF